MLRQRLCCCGRKFAIDEPAEMKMDWLVPATHLQLPMFVSLPMKMSEFVAFQSFKRNN